MSNEDQVVPALGMKKPIDFNTVGEDEMMSSAKDSAGPEVSAS
jgi:hypothetical protein